MYDALLFLSFGGPEGPDDVMPFLENVLRGKNVPRARMLEVAEHYYHHGGVSPINAQNRALIDALKEELAKHGIALPIYFGNRNWHPMLEDTLREMANDGIQRALVFITSAYSSYSGCRQYRENIAEARAAVGDQAPVCDKLRVFYNHPGFVGPNVEHIRACLESLPEERRSTAHIAFTAHSIPHSMAKGCDYEVQLQEACRLVAQALDVPQDRYALVYQSRSGPPHQPWLEPDICDHLESLAGANVQDVVVSPLGFISDHLEVLYDLDDEAATRAQELGLSMQRASTVGTHPDFVAMIRELIEERISEAPRRALGMRGPNHDTCPPGCCAYNPRRRPSAASG